MIKRILYLLYINFPFILILLAMAFLNTGCASGSNINEDSPSKFKIVTNDLLKIKQEPINFPILGKAIKEATSILNLEITSYPIKKYNHVAILEEDKTKPLSDNKISTILAQENIKLARRTVAKYREQMRILPV